MNSSPSSTKVLIVDDDVISRVALAGVLRRVNGLEVVEASDGLAAWQLLEEGLRPRVCCTDLGMPGLDGLGLMDRIRAHPILNDLPVVLITGTADRETVLAAMQRGAAGYIVKPFVAADTLGTLQRVVRAAQMSVAEQPAATRSRLQQDAGGLARLLATLRDQASQLGACVSQSPDPASVQPQLESLRTGCLTLGLWRAAELIQGTPALADDPVGAPVILAEVAHHAADQLVRMGQAADFAA